MPLRIEKRLKKETTKYMLMSDVVYVKRIFIREIDHLILFNCGFNQEGDFLFSFLNIYFNYKLALLSASLCYVI